MQKPNLDLFFLVKQKFIKQIQKLIKNLFFSLSVLGLLISPSFLKPAETAEAFSYVYINGYPTFNGNYLDCFGNIDNDMAHHTTDINDTDPAHNSGKICPTGSLFGSTQQTSAPTAQNPSSTPSTPATQPTAPSVLTQAAAVYPLDVWWPVNGANVSGIQPFKTMLQNVSVSEYNMYWQVDTGQLNFMSSNYEGYPHKETMVDLSGWNWKGTGPYTVTFIAKNFSGAEIGRTSVNINVQSQSVPSPTPSPQPAPSPAPSPTPVPTPNPENYFSGAKLYVNPYSDPANWANSHRSYEPYNASLMDKVAKGAESQWFGGWNQNIEQDVNNVVTAVTAAGALPVLVAYNIPNRDCGGYSSGGVGSPAAYQQWIRDFAKGIGSRKAAILLEPDATALTSCLSPAELQIRYDLLKDAVNVFKNNGQAVYIDAAHPSWISAPDMALRLKQAGIDQADGFALNISNFHTTQNNITHGQQISNLTGDKHFVIDIGRNGNGPEPSGQWCNPPGRALGRLPTTSTGNVLVDALLWVKGPGGSDGNCNGGPSAGVFWPDYALELAKSTSW